MTRSKSFLVTVLMSIMLAAIVYGLYRLQIKAYTWIVLILAFYGFLNASAGFYRWLNKGAPMAPAINYEEEYDGADS